MATKKVFLDPGHGGKDPGACNGKRTEASDVLKLGLAIKKKLLAEYNNISVGITLVQICLFLFTEIVQVLPQTDILAWFLAILEKLRF